MNPGHAWATPRSLVPDAKQDGPGNHICSHTQAASWAWVHDRGLWGPPGGCECQIDMLTAAKLAAPCPYRERCGQSSAGKEEVSTRLRQQPCCGSEPRSVCTSHGMCEVLPACAYSAISSTAKRRPRDEIVESGPRGMPIDVARPCQTPNQSQPANSSLLTPHRSHVRALWELH